MEKEIILNLFHYLLYLVLKSVFYALSAFSFFKWRINPLVIDIINIRKDIKKKIDNINDVRKLGELMPIIPKIGQSGAIMRNIRYVTLSFGPK